MSGIIVARGAVVEMLLSGVSQLSTQAFLSLLQLQLESKLPIYNLACHETGTISSPLNAEKLSCILQQETGMKMLSLSSKTIASSIFIQSSPNQVNK